MPAFSAPGVERPLETTASGQRSLSITRPYSLSDELAEHDALLVVYCPLPAAGDVARRRTLRTAEWFTFIDDVRVVGITGGSVHARWAAAGTHCLSFPLLDSTGPPAPLAAGGEPTVFLIDGDRIVRYVHRAAAGEPLDFRQVKEAVGELLFPFGRSGPGSWRRSSGNPSTVAGDE